MLPIARFRQPTGKGPDASEADLELLDASDPVVSTEERVATADGTRLRTALLAGAGLVALVGVVASLTRPAAEPGQEEAIEQTTTSTVDVDDGPTTLPPTTAPPTEMTPLPAGVTTGVWLFTGGEGPLQRIDLDTGTVETYGLRARPILAAGGELLVAIESSSAIGWVGLGDPGQQGNGWAVSDVAYGTTPGTVWLRRHSPGDEWLNFDLESNVILARRPVTASPQRVTSLEGRGALMVPGPELLATPSGVFRTTEEGSQRIGSGRLLAFDQSRALVEQCPQSLETCTVEWRTSDSWQLIDLPRPSSTDVHYAEIMGGGTWLLAVDQSTGMIELLPLAGDRDGFDFPPSATLPSVSNDGRWMAHLDPETSTIEVYDLDAERLLSTIEGSTFDQNSVLLVDKASTGG